jgi:hypothetical protein
MYSELPAYLRRDLRRLHGRIHHPVVWPITLDMLLLRIRSALGHPSVDAVVLDSWQWRTATGFGAKASRQTIERALPVGCTYYRRGDILIVERRAS